MATNIRSCKTGVFLYLITGIFIVEYAISQILSYFVRMHRFLFFLPVLLLVPYFALAQLPLDHERYADSLNTILKTATSDSLKARTNFMLTYYWMSKDPQKAKECLEEGRRLSKNIPYLDALSYAHEGYVYYVTDMSKSEAAYKKADSMLSRFNSKEAYLARSNIWVNLAVIQQRQDNDREYINMMLGKAIPLALKAGDSIILGSQYVGLGVAFMNTDQYEKAEIYFNKAILILKNGQPSRLIAAYNRAGENYTYLGKYDKVKEVLDKTRQLLAPYPESELYAGYYMIEGLYFQHEGKHNQAVNSFVKGIATANGPNKNYVIQELKFYQVKSLLALKEYKKAINVLQSLAADEEAMSMDNSRLEVYESMAAAYAGTSQMGEAYSWLKKFSLLNDSLHKAQFRRDINELEIKYQNAEEERQIVALKAKNTQVQLEARNNRLLAWLMAGGFAVLLLITILIWLYYRNNKKLLAQKEVNHRQQIKEMEQQQRLQYGQAILQGEEQERRRLARDLHDGLGGMLAGVKINLSGKAENSSSPDQKEELQNIITQLDSSVTELRRIAHNMMPVNLIKFGLQTALKDLCESLMSEQTKIDFQAYGIDSNIPEQTQINIYRIVQEMLTNAVRHAEARNIMLQCSQNNNTFYITQEDDGKGFDIGAIDSGKGIGLANIRNRVGFLKGKIDIESAKGEGTTINIELQC